MIPSLVVRGVLAVMLCATVVVAHGANVSQDCRAALRDRRVTLVVPYAAGGGHDQYARALAPALQRASGARVSVSNVPAGSGLAGARAVADGDGDTLRLGIFEASLVLNTLRHVEPGIDQFVPLGSITAEAQVWSARPGFSLAGHRGRPLVASVSDAGANVVEVALVAHSLGVPLRFTPGYKGSADRFAAVMRREVDITANSMTTSLKATRGGDLEAVLVVSDGPHPDLPGVPWLAGAGGLVERLTAGQPAAARAEAARAARHAVEMSTSLRSVFVSAKVSGQTLRCLGEMVDESLFSEEFARAASAVGRPLSPIGARDTRAAIERLREGTAANRDLLRRLLDAAVR